MNETSQTVEVEVQCHQCQGTGLYSGMAESKDTAVVCYQCKGTGKDTLTYKTFTGRKPRPEITWVYQVNPGIRVGGKTPGKYGGMPVQNWLDGKPFPAKSENRECTCPAWWYQSADYGKKPSWGECPGFGTFSSCKYFSKKNLCWDKWDRENSK